MTMSALDAITSKIDPIILLDQLVPQLTVRSAYGPTMTFDRPFAPDASADPTSPAAWLRPALDVTLATGGVKTIAPYGDPGETAWPTVKLIGIVGGVTLLGLGVAWALGR